MSDQFTKLLSPKGSTSILATTTSANVPLQGNGPTLRIANGGAVPAFIFFGTDNTVVATLQSLQILPGTVEAFTEPRAGLTYMAAITETGQARIGVTRCEGDQ